MCVRGRLRSLSKRQYAKHRGVSEAAVRKAIKAGRITAEADGSIDPKKADAQWSANTRPNLVDRIAAQEEAQGKKPPVEKEIDNTDNTNNTANSSKIRIQLTAESTYQDAKTANEIYKARLTEIEVQKAEGEYIEKQPTLDQIFQLAREERDSWLNWPTRISAVMAAKLQVDEIVLLNTLNEAVREHLSELGEFKTEIKTKNKK